MTATVTANGASPMGRVTTEATIENLRDLWATKEGRLGSEDIRRIVVSDALVDTGATLLSLPADIIRTLGLELSQTKNVRSSSGLSQVGLHEAVRLTIQGRICTMDVLETPEGTPVLIGQIPLEHLDFVVDMRARKLIGNPAHGGEHMYELY